MCKTRIGFFCSLRKCWHFICNSLLTSNIFKLLFSVVLNGVAVCVLLFGHTTSVQEVASPLCEKKLIENYIAWEKVNNNKVYQKTALVLKHIRKKFLDIRYLYIFHVYPMSYFGRTFLNKFLLLFIISAQNLITRL